MARGEPVPDPGPPLDQCARCGAPLEPDQEWCVACGAARTIIHPPPDPRIGLAIVGALALAVLGAVVAVIAAADGGGGSSPGARSTATATSRPATRAATLADWPVGLSGWTVVLGRSPQRSPAVALARQVAAGGIAAGVLDSTQHPHLQPGYFVVFSGRYPDGAAAQAAAAALRARGQPHAIAREVARPGGL